MIDINELRDRAATFGSDYLTDEEWIEVIDRLEAAEKERDALRAKIEAMEQQEPIATKLETHQLHSFRVSKEDADKLTALPVGSPLYALPVAQPELNLSDPAVQKRLAAQWGYVQKPHPDCDSGCMFQCAQPASSVPDAIDPITRQRGATFYAPNFVAGWNACREEMLAAAPSVPEGWLTVPEKHPTFEPVDLQLSDGSVLCGCVPQADGDYWWAGPSGEVFIDPKYASVTHWRLAAAPEPEGE